mgnify:CR=1 FL=1
MSAAVGATIKRQFTESFRSNPAVERVRGRPRSDTIAGWSAGRRVIAGSSSATSHLGAAAVPTLVLAGGKGAAAPPAVAEATAAEAVPGVRFTVKPGVPHATQVKVGPAFTEAAAGSILGGAASA